MRITCLLLSLLSFGALAHTTVQWPSNESRIDADMAPSKDPIPPPIVFETEVAKAQPTTFEQSRGLEYVNQGPYVGGYGYGYGFSGVTGGLNGVGGFPSTPQIRSNALSSPQGMPGGSRPGLLP